MVWAVGNVWHVTVSISAWSRNFPVYWKSLTLMRNVLKRHFKLLLCTNCKWKDGHRPRSMTFFSHKCIAEVFSMSPNNASSQLRELAVEMPKHTIVIMSSYFPTCKIWRIEVSVCLSSSWFRKQRMKHISSSGINYVFSLALNSYFYKTNLYTDVHILVCSACRYCMLKMMFSDASLSGSNSPLHRPAEFKLHPHHGGQSASWRLFRHLHSCVHRRVRGKSFQVEPHCELGLKEMEDTRVC